MLGGSRWRVLFVGLNEDAPARVAVRPAGRGKAKVARSGGRCSTFVLLYAFEFGYLLAPVRGRDERRGPRLLTPGAWEQIAHGACGDRRRPGHRGNLLPRSSWTARCATRMRWWWAALLERGDLGSLHYEVGDHTALILPVIAAVGFGLCLLYERTGIPVRGDRHACGVQHRSPRSGSAPLPGGDPGGPRHDRRLRARAARSAGTRDRARCPRERRAAGGARARAPLAHALRRGLRHLAVRRGVALGGGGLRLPAAPGPARRRPGDGRPDPGAVRPARGHARPGRRVLPALPT